MHRYSTAISERLDAEVSLLSAMYPGSVVFNPTNSELDFRPPEFPKAQLSLRLPDNYPEHGRPEVVLACDNSKNDLRQVLTRSLSEFGADEGEVLDALLQKFLDLANTPTYEPDSLKLPTSTQSPPAFKTVIIWLHHLLAPSKRSLAIRPSWSSQSISGLTKPGYPGIMIFTGSRDAVADHVAELKALRWQAFQVRYEGDELWKIDEVESAKGIIEVETMADVVSKIPEEYRKLCLKAIGVK